MHASRSDWIGRATKNSAWFFRGFTPTALLVHPKVEIVEGRMPVPGNDEIMVGGLVPDKMGIKEDRLGVGNTLWFDNRDWKVVGRFRARGTVMDAEVWAPLNRCTGRHQTQYRVLRGTYPR